MLAIALEVMSTEGIFGFRHTNASQHSMMASAPTGNGSGSTNRNKTSGIFDFSTSRNKVWLYTDDGLTKAVLSDKCIQVVRFHVWQDLTAEISSGLAPLHATLTLEMSNEWYQSLSKPGGNIRIQADKTQDVLEAKLLVYQAHYGLGLGQPGSKQMQFMMSPSPLCARLSPNETVKGAASIRFMEKQVTIQLPETKVIFTR